jgi:hypothetical protein
MLTGVIRELATVQPGEPDIGHKEIDSHVTLEHPQSSQAIGGLYGPIAELLQHIDNKVSHCRFVLNYQDDLAVLGTVLLAKAR